MKSKSIRKKEKKPRSQEDSQRQKLTKISKSEILSRPKRWK